MKISVQMLRDALMRLSDEDRVRWLRDRKIACTADPEGENDHPSLDAFIFGCPTPLKLLKGSLEKIKKL